MGKKKTGGIFAGRGGMTPTPLPMKGRSVGVYGFLDGNRGSSGVMLFVRGNLTSRCRDSFSLRTEPAVPAVPAFRSASSVCAPCFPFGKARCSGRLILHKQSTGLFIPKRSTFRASPLRGTVHRTVDSETLDLQGYAPPGEPQGSLNPPHRIQHKPPYTVLPHIFGQTKTVHPLKRRIHRGGALVKCTMSIPVRSG